MKKITLVMRTPRRATVLFFAFLLVFGGAFWVAMKWAARGAGSLPPASAVWGVPDRPIRFVSYNIRHGERGLPRIIDEISKLQPDFVLLQEVEREHLSTMTRDLRSMPAVYHASENLAGGPRASWGNAILSRHRLYEGQSIPNPGGGGSFGVWATAAIDGKKFRVASVHLSDNRELTNLVKAWEDAGRPPIVLGGDFNQVAIDNYWIDALKGLGKDKSARVDHLLVSKEWKVIDGGVVDSDASEHRPIWIRTGK